MNLATGTGTTVERSPWPLGVILPPTVTVRGLSAVEEKDKSVYIGSKVHLRRSERACIFGLLAGNGGEGSTLLK